jgi:L-iditol 2-dehydrogenase
MAARLAKLKGAAFVAMTGLAAACPREDARFRLARDFGCDVIIETDKENIEDTIKTRFPQGLDRAIVTSPPQSMYDALKVIRFGGLITFLGLHFGGKNIINVDVNDLVFRKITLRPTFAEPAINFPVAIRLLKEGLIDSKKLVTHTFGFNEAKSMMQAIIDGSKPVIKAVMVPD